MSLFKLNDFNSSYHRTFGDIPIQQFEVYSEQGKPLGHVDDVLVDTQGRLQQLVITRNDAIAGNSVLLPIQQTRIDQQTRRVYLTGASHATTHTNSAVATNRATAEQSRHVAKSLEMSAPLEASVPLESSVPLEGQTVRTMTPPRGSSVPAQPVPPTAQPLQQSSAEVPSPTLSQPSSEATATLDQATIQLLEERLVIDRSKRRKVGEVVARKVIETRMVEVPVRREKLIIEQVSPEYQQLAVVDLGPTEVQSDVLKNINASESS